MNPGDRAAELARQQRPRLGELLITQDLAGDGLAFDPLHDEANAEFVLRPQHVHHFGRRQAGIMRELHQHGFGIEPGRAAGRRAITLRRAAQDRADMAARVHDVERPGLLAGAAGQFCRVRDPGRAGKKRGDAAPEFGLHHLPLNFAGRFSRKAVTPSLKSVVEPAMRCDWNSRSSWSSNELSGLSQ